MKNDTSWCKGSSPSERGQSKSWWRKNRARRKLRWVANKPNIHSFAGYGATFNWWRKPDLHVVEKFGKGRWADLYVWCMEGVKPLVLKGYCFPKLTGDDWRMKVGMWGQSKKRVPMKTRQEFRDFIIWISFMLKGECKIKFCGRHQKSKHKECCSRRRSSNIMANILLLLWMPILDRNLLETKPVFLPSQFLFLICLIYIKTENIN